MTEDDEVGPADRTGRVGRRRGVASALREPPGNAGLRERSVREAFDGPRYVLRAGAPWRTGPDDLPPRRRGVRQARPRLRTGAFERLVHDPNTLSPTTAQREPAPPAAVPVGRPLAARPRTSSAGYDGAERRRGAQLRQQAR